MRQQLEKERLELERKREENDAKLLREMVVSQQTPSMDVPVTMAMQASPSPNQVTIEVPNTVLEVREGWKEGGREGGRGITYFRGACLAYGQILLVIFINP